MRRIQQAAAPLTVLVASLSVALTSAADGARPASARSSQVSTFAILGDTPYSAAERQQFPNLVRSINAAPDVSMVLHAGDIKSGDSLCTDVMYQDRRALFNTFVDPFVLTPGDNEWTDCHKQTAGQFVPTERLAHLREIFYKESGGTLGKNPATTATQASTENHAKFRENLRFIRSQVVFATVHVVGSDNDLSPWSGLPNGDQPSVRQAEYKARNAANLAWIDAAFDRAEATSAAGVLLLMQAEPTNTTSYQALRSKIFSRTRAFDGKVLLVHGDEHRYEVEKAYGGVSNLTRLETFGVTATHWLRLTVDPSASAVFSWAPRTVS